MCQLITSSLPHLASTLSKANHRMAPALEHLVQVRAEAVLTMQYKGHLWDQAYIHNTCVQYPSSQVLTGSMRMSDYKWTVASQVYLMPWMPAWQ